MTNSDDDNVGVLLGNGDGTFQTQITYSAGNDPEFILSADFNKDKKLDLAVTNSYHGENYQHTIWQW